MTASYPRFANLLFGQEYEGGVCGRPISQGPACAEFKLAHLEGTLGILAPD